MFAYRHYKHKKRMKIAILFRILVFLIVAIIIFVVIDIRLRPVIITMSQYQCRVSSTLAMSEAVLQVLDENEKLANSIIESDKNVDGEIINVRIDANKLNQLKTRLTFAVARRLASLERQEVSVPLGTLLGWQLMAGRGPDIHLRIVPTSYVQSEITDRLETSGINQTKYGIYIKFKVTMSAILPGYSTSVSVEDEVCIAQTLIVGDVPQVYAVSDK